MFLVCSLAGFATYVICPGDPAVAGEQARAISAARYRAVDVIWSRHRSRLPGQGVLRRPEVLEPGRGAAVAARRVPVDARCCCSGRSASPLARSCWWRTSSLMALRARVLRRALRVRPPRSAGSTPSSRSGSSVVSSIDALMTRSRSSESRPMGDAATYERDGHVATITYNRPGEAERDQRRAAPATSTRRGSGSATTRTRGSRSSPARARRSASAPTCTTARARPAPGRARSGRSRPSTRSSRGSRSGSRRSPR